MPGLFSIQAWIKWIRLCHWILVNIHSWPGSKLQEIKTCVRQHREQKQGFNRISTNQNLAAATCSTSGTYTIYQQQFVKHINFPHPAYTNCFTMHHFNNLTYILSLDFEINSYLIFFLSLTSKYSWGKYDFLMDPKHDQYVNPNCRNSDAADTGN